MKFTLPFLKPGEKVTAQVVEVLADHDCIVNFSGDLIRVKNTSGRKFQPGEAIALEVMRINPLAFRIYSSQTTHLDRRI